MSAIETLPETDVEIRDAVAEDAHAIAAIYAWHVLNGRASFEEVPPTVDEMRQRMHKVNSEGLPGLVALYPLVWLCMLVGTLALVYTGYLLYVGIPMFLNIDREESLRFSGPTLAIGALVLEVLLALTVLLWGYGYLMV